MLRRDANQTAPPHKSTAIQASGALVLKDAPLFYAQGLILDKDANLFNPNSFNLFFFFGHTVVTFVPFPTARLA